MRFRRPALPFALLPIFLVVFAACSDDEALPNAPELTSRDGSPSASRSGSSQAGVIKERSIPRFDVAMNIAGSFRPGADIQVRLVSRALLPTREATLEIQMPELEAARLSGFDESFRLPVNRPLAREATRRQPMGQGSEVTLGERVLIPEPGYYRVVGYVQQGPEDALRHDGQFVRDAALVQKWVWIDEKGGKVTERFERSLFPDSLRVAPGPFRPRAGKGIPSPPDGQQAASLFGVGKAAIRSLVGTVRRAFGLSSSGTITIEVLYHEPETNEVRPFSFVERVHTYTDYSDYYDPEEVTSSGWLGSDATMTAGCPDIYESSHYYDFFTEGWKAVVSDTDGSTYAAGTISIEHNQCTDGPFLEQAFGTRSLRDRAFVEMNFSINQALLDFDRTRGVVDVQMIPSSPGIHSAYFPGDDRIDLEEDEIPGERGIFITAHEYGHAYDEKAMNGIRGEPACPDSGHSFDGAHNMGCAYDEGFADYFAAWTRRHLSDAEFRYPAEFENNEDYPAVTGNGDPNDGSLIEGAVAAFLWDLTDGANEPHDGLALPATYVVEELAVCKVSLNQWYAQGIDEAIWCFEGEVDSSVYDTYFPNGTSPQIQSGALKPNGWSQQGVRDLWLENLYANW